MQDTKVDTGRETLDARRAAIAEERETLNAERAGLVVDALSDEGADRRLAKVERRLGELAADDERAALAIIELARRAERAAAERAAAERAECERALGEARARRERLRAELALAFDTLRPLTDDYRATVQTIAGLQGTLGRSGLLPNVAEELVALARVRLGLGWVHPRTRREVLALGRVDATPDDAA